LAREDNATAGPGFSAGQRVFAVAVHAGHVCAGLQDGSIRTWRLDTKEAGVLVGHSGIVGALASAGPWLVSGCNDADVRVWNVAAGMCVGKLEGHTKRVVSLAASGVRVVSGSWDFRVRVWREVQVVGLDHLAGSDEPVPQYDSDIQPATRWGGAVYLPPPVAHEQLPDSDRSRWASGPHDRLVQERLVHSAAGWGCERDLYAGERVYCVEAWGARVAAGLQCGDVVVWDVESGAAERRVRAHSKIVYGLAAAGGRLYSSSLDGCLKAWSTDTWICEQTVGKAGGVPGAYIRTLGVWGGAVVGGESSNPCAAGQRYAVRAWDAATLRPLGERRQAAGEAVLSVACGGGGAWAAAGERVVAVMGGPATRKDSNRRC
jgi:WD40 repeat protein